MSAPTYRDQLTALRSEHYTGAGGAAALARDLGVHTQSLKAWRAGRVQPTWKHREAIEKLWREKCAQ